MNPELLAISICALAPLAIWLLPKAWIAYRLVTRPWTVPGAWVHRVPFHAFESAPAPSGSMSAHYRRAALRCWHCR